MNDRNLETRRFDVVIPNLEENGIGEIVPIEVQVFIDPETGEEVLTPESLALIEKTKARRMGLLSAEEIKGLRTRLNLTQEDFSELLQIGAKTCTRWEAGHLRPSRSMNVLLCTLRDGGVSIDYLDHLRNVRERRDWGPFLTRRLGNSVLLFPGTKRFSRRPDQWRVSRREIPWAARKAAPKQGKRGLDPSSLGAWEGSCAA